MLSTIVLLGLHAENATAEEPQRDPAAAEKLFRSGRAAFKRGDFTTAYKDFSESQRLDPAVGTELNLSECEENIGQTASAWHHLREAIDLMVVGDSRLPIARERLPRLEKRVPRLIVRLKAGAPMGTVIMRDGAELRAAALGSPEAIDPGEHVLQIHTPGHGEETIRVSMSEGETRTVEVAPGSALLSAGTPTAATESNDGASQRTAAYFVAGAGILGLGIGGALGLISKTAYERARADCHGDPTHCTDQSAVERGDAAQAQQTLSTIAYVVGAVLLTGGAALFITAPRRRVVQVVAVGAGLSIRGGW